MTSSRPHRFLIAFTSIALVGACGQVAEPPGADSGIDPGTPDAGAGRADADPSAPDASDDPLAPYSDSFDTIGLDPSWSQFQTHLIDFDAGAGQLSMQPNGYAQWYNREQGPLIYKDVSGDFRVTSRVRTSNTLDPSAPPADPISLGGLMARAPGSVDTSPNYVFIVVGRDANDLSVEPKTTVDGMSTYEGPSWPSGEAQLRICRLGDTFYMLKRPIDGGDWEVAQTYERPDLPASVQVGMISYHPDDQPHLAVSFDEVAFATVATKSDCVD